ncbi:aldolase/citrate lyase family protein [Pseudomonadota bacterium]
MNKTEKKMIELLKELKDSCGVVEIKAEYENEGSRPDELMRLKDVAGRAGLPVIIKIGGVEAVSDIYSAITLGAKAVIAPMAETKFAVSKFTSAINSFVPSDIRSDTDFFINIETITAYNNLDDILSLDGLSMLDGVTIGRVDFTASMGKDRGFANSDEMLQYCENIFRKCRENNLKCGLGGAISTESESFIRRLVEKDLVDKFETRKVVYDKSALDTMTKGILLGVQFELLWLESKANYYHRIKIEDQKRILMLKDRLN